MPKWGLSPEQRKSEPWGLPEVELCPAKTITDPIHHDVFLTKLEQRVLDSPPMQRLRRVRQLGTAHLVYPGATHSRFSHSLGALRAAQDLLDVVVDHRHSPHPVPDLFAEWKSTLTIAEYDHRVAEATVLARLGALLHDMCHIPFGHSIEDDLGLLDPHDSNEQRFEKLWNQLDSSLQRLITDDLRDALRFPLILSKLQNHEPTNASKRYPFVGDIVGNTICADLIDYLQRDHEFTGLPAKLGNRFIHGFYVTRSDHTLEPQRMVLQISRDGRERRDVVSELFKYLRYRYELSERALNHHAKLSADAMVGKLFEMWKDSLWVDKACSQLPAKRKQYIPDLAKFRSTIIMRHNKRKLPERIDKEIIDELEGALLSHGDDGLLEFILQSNASASSADIRKKGIVDLACALLDRRLFKLIGHCDDRTIAQRLYNEYGAGTEDSRRASRQLQTSISEYVGLEQPWYVLLWVPSPAMRLKAADVLVDNGENVTPLSERDKASNNRGKEIYDAHQALWSINVYAEPSIAQDPEIRDCILAWIARKLGVKWSGIAVQPDLGGLAARKVSIRRDLSSVQESELAETAMELAAHAGADTFAGLVEKLDDAADEILGISVQGDLPLGGET